MGGAQDNKQSQPIVWDEELLRRFWSFYANQPETYFGFAKGADVVRYARRYLARGDLILDYGCGPGFLLHELLKAGFSAGGADISTDVIGRNGPPLGSQKNLLGLFAIDDLLKRGRAFDAIFLVEVVEHLYDEALTATLHNCRTLLRPGGRLFVTTPNDERRQHRLLPGFERHVPSLAARQKLEFDDTPCCASRARPQGRPGDYVHVPGPSGTADVTRPPHRALSPRPSQKAEVAVRHCRVRRRRNPAFSQAGAVSNRHLQLRLANVRQ
jgi:SAM-dependent methyltransferase